MLNWSGFLIHTLPAVVFAETTTSEARGQESISLAISGGVLIDFPLLLKVLQPAGWRGKSSPDNLLLLVWGLVLNLGTPLLGEDRRNIFSFVVFF